MNKLETGINMVLKQLKSELAAETWESRRRYYNQMRRLAHSLGINEPCQMLYHAYVADDNGSKERKALRIRCVKLLDAITGTNAMDEYRILYNEQPMPSKEETQGYFHGLKYPLADKVSIEHLIVKAEIEMQYLYHSESTIGQYRHAWIDIRRYFHRHNFLNYDEQLLQSFIREIGILRDNGSMKEWKWKINRKAAHVLMEVADTGQFHWGLIKKRLTCNGIEIEIIRKQYLESLKHRNLSRSTINLHDYVFRNLAVFTGIGNSNDLLTLTPEKIHLVIIKFAGICSNRSMATVLPILRSLLIFFYASGHSAKDLSCVVMNGFTQRGSVAGYIAQKDQAVLFKHIDQEPKRTKAIILLAIKLGLRDCDISNLTFQEIDWHNDKIRLLQKKTGKGLILPLFPDIGNALMEYILHERPKRDDRYPYIFLRKQAPYNKIASAYHTCSKFLKKLEIKPVNSPATGVHIFRYTLVHRLLAAKTSHQVITDVLGHISKESDKPYLSMEESMLRLCALDLSVIGRVSWKGGLK